jgi:glycosyltransferase involved in cell wall biosynthesis
MIVSYGHFVSQAVKKDRQLYSNVAGSNRMLRIAEAFQTGTHVTTVILAPGTCLRSPFRRRVVYPARIERREAILIVTCRAIAIPVVSIICEPFFAIATLVKLHFKHKMNTVVLYSYYPSVLAVGLVARFILSAKIVFDLEDISRPSWKDWKRSSGVRPLQQLWGAVLQFMVTCVAHWVIIPTNRFIPHIKPVKRHVVVTGCMRCNKFSESAQRADSSVVEILYAGGISSEQGFDILVDALTLLDADERGGNISVHICGAEALNDEREHRLSVIKTFAIQFHGFLSNEGFQKLFARVDVCLALQRPEGRHSQYKTPSKAYEAMCAGKMVVVSDVGDFSMLPPGICKILNPYSAAGLADCLASITRNEANAYGQNALQYASDNWDIDIVGDKLAQRMGHPCRSDSGRITRLNT